MRLFWKRKELLSLKFNALIGLILLGLDTFLPKIDYSLALVISFGLFFA